LTRPDEEVWRCAAANGFVLVSADSDFFERATTLGPPPKVVWLRDWRYSTREAEALLRKEAIRVATFVDDPDLAILMLDRS
jgi:predicted nuclease of predicted toxin-antitoxin system